MIFWKTFGGILGEFVGGVPCEIPIWIDSNNISGEKPG